MTGYRSGENSETTEKVIIRRREGSLQNSLPPEKRIGLGTANIGKGGGGLVKVGVRKKGGPP